MAPSPPLLEGGPRQASAMSQRSPEDLYDEMVECIFEDTVKLDKNLAHLNGEERDRIIEEFFEEEEEERAEFAKKFVWNLGLTIPTLKIPDQLSGKKGGWEEVHDELCDCCLAEDYNELNPLEVTLQRIRKVGFY